MFVSKYERKHRLESAREKRIQNIQLEKGCTREYAVRFCDYQNQMASHNFLKIVSSGLFAYGSNKILNVLSHETSLLNKMFVRLPVVGLGSYLGWILYEKLDYHYLNFTDRDSSHLWELDIAKKYGVKQVEYPDNWENSLALTPFERLKEQESENLKKVNVEGEKVYRRISKDKNDFFYLFGKIRNLENIIYAEDKLKDKKSINPVELQMIVDSVKPTIQTSSDLNNIVESIHNKISDYKKDIENSRNFRSIKDKFLGLPFMILRHQQYPKPYPNTWQWDLYKQLFGEEFDRATYQPETEEKINKYNYHQFLHPSVIDKFDTNSEEFDMYLRKLNMESRTDDEKRAENREFYCKNLLPVLNLIDNKEIGYDFANYVINKSKSNEYGNYLYENYSGQKEEALFREAEEAKYLNKNRPFVERVVYSTILKDKIGIKPQELNELLTNPTKFKKMRKAVEQKYSFYEPTTIIDWLKMDRRKKTLIDTVIDRELDPNSPDFNIDDLTSLQMDKGEEENEEEQAIMANHVNYSRLPGLDVNSYPYGSFHLSKLFYNPNLDWNDYARDFKSDVLPVSPKQNRFEMYNNFYRDIHDSFFVRSYNNPAFRDRSDYIIPSIDYKNEELKSKVLRRSNYHRFVDNLYVRDSEKEKLEFLENKTMEDSYDVSPDVTEEELDQALFEATYAKPYWESEEYRSLDKRNNREIEQIFKILDLDVHSHWIEPGRGKKNDENGIPFTDKAQMLDPMVRLITEVEQPQVMKDYIRKWRSGAEMRFKMPYYPDTLPGSISKSFNYV